MGKTDWGMDGLPYPRAHYYVAGLLVFVVLAFWPSFFSDLSNPPLAFKVHGITATLWVLLLIVQSWAIHSGRPALHRQLGKSSFVLFPLFLMGLMMVTQTMAARGVAEGSPMEQTIPSFGIVSIISVAVVSYLFYEALRSRRNIRLHASYLLATPFLLIESVFGRIFTFYVPGLALSHSEDAAQFSLNFHLSELLGVSIALYLYARDRRHGRPFLVVALAMILHSATYHWMGPASWWTSVYLSMGGIPMTVVVVAGLALGGLVTWLGWLGNSRPSRGIMATA